ncbi:hypothetical protein BpHYR1_042216 [Brachionus plicatilis]|uniref:Protein FAM136A n=1 Tax=Brachionus plicatilis TaxID=10195 RepID=A0A3M7P1C8_BRAPC|nr:hypothetical protein BpHYR1_042216 [Brachionus plicatilis]
MENFANKVQEEIDSIDREYLRKIQGNMFRCNANCCDNPNISQTDLERCLETCSHPAVKAQQFMNQQMQEIQDRVQRCLMSCADEIKDKAMFNKAEDLVNSAEMKKCSAKCEDEMLKILPNYTKKMREWLSKGNNL